MGAVDDTIMGVGVVDVALAVLEDLVWNTLDVDGGETVDEILDEPPFDIG